MQTVTVALGERSYPIHIGGGLLGAPRADRCRICRKSAWRSSPTRRSATSISTRLSGALRRRGRRRGAGRRCPTARATRTGKRSTSYSTRCSTHRCERKTTLIALGGGVIGDLTGFAAATYLRGVPFIQVPTTLLAQVDSSVGGKTGINHPLGKNMIGAFYQPRAGARRYRHAATRCRDRELSAGLAEVIKYGLIRDAAFLRLARSQHRRARRARRRGARLCGPALLRDQSARSSARMSARTGVRALLNLGHTFGHAIEAGLGFGAWLHGEAVAAGMRAGGARCRSAWGCSTRSDVARIDRAVQSAPACRPRRPISASRATSN